MITDKKKWVQLFNDCYINIAEQSCGFKLEKKNSFWIMEQKWGLKFYFRQLQKSS